ncbi:PAS domain S-box protein [Pseudoxanthomonas sp. NC8]|nr:PAS domain S-box protein [Pseudoxanthomonas sp. NC8]
MTRRKEQADVLRTLLEAAPSGLLVLDETGTVRYANVEVARTFGYPQEAMAGLHVGLLLASETRAQDLRLWQRFIEEAQPDAMGGAHDLHGVRHGGEAFPMEVRMCRVHLEDHTRIMAAITDLSARKQLEYEMAMERESVAHLARVTMLGELSGSLAHELNQPLTAILSNAQAALRIIDRDPSDLEQVREILADIVETDRRAGHVIGRLRGMLRREARRVRAAGRQRSRSGMRAPDAQRPAQPPRFLPAKPDAWIAGVPRRCDPAAAGPDEPDPQRLRCAAGRPDQPHRPGPHQPLRCRGVRRGGRYRHRHPGRHARAHLHAVRDDQGHRHGHGPSRMSYDRTCPWRAHLGGEREAAGCARFLRTPGPRVIHVCSRSYRRR